eukprot:g1555.t1
MVVLRHITKRYLRSKRSLNLCKLRYFHHTYASASSKNELSKTDYDHDSDGEDEENGFQPDDENEYFLIRRLNYNFQHTPLEAFVSAWGLEIGTLFGAYALLNLTGVTVSADFAVAFAVNRLVRRFRYPVDLAATGLLTQIAPPLTRIQISLLLRNVQNLGNKNPELSQEEQLERQGAGPTTRFISRNLNKFNDALLQLLDKVGVCYFIAARFVGGCSVGCLYYGISHGMDVNEVIMKPLGLEMAGDLLGTWALAVVFTGTCYPLTIAASAFLAPELARLRKQIM